MAAIIGKTRDVAEFIKSRYGKTITVQFGNNPPLTGILKHYRGLGTDTPQILIDAAHSGMIWVDIDRSGSVEVGNDEPYAKAV